MYIHGLLHVHGLVVYVGTACILHFENRYLEEVIPLDPQRSRAIIHQGPRNLGHAGLEPLSSASKLIVASKLGNRGVFRQGPPLRGFAQSVHIVTDTLLLWNLLGKCLFGMLCVSPNCQL